MNLYKIQFLHASPKDREYGMKCLLLAKNDEQVYDWLASEPEIGDGRMFNSWTDTEKDDKVFNLYNDAYDVIGTETFKEKMIRLNGEMNDDDYDYSDAFYGITLYGWSLLKENVTTDYSELNELGIVYKAI